MISFSTLLVAWWKLHPLIWLLAAIKAQGIPSNAAFLTAVSRGKVTAEDLVEKAIAHGRLSPETINDRAYLNNVSSHLRNLNND